MEDSKRLTAELIISIVIIVSYTILAALKVSNTLELMYGPLMGAVAGYWFGKVANSGKVQ